MVVMLFQRESYSFSPFSVVGYRKRCYHGKFDGPIIAVRKILNEAHYILNIFLSIFSPFLDPSFPREKKHRPGAFP